MRKITEAKALDRCTVCVTFDNGEKRFYDMDNDGEVTIDRTGKHIHTSDDTASAAEVFDMGRRMIGG